MVLTIKREGRVAVLKLTRPDSLNTLSGDLHDALNAAVADVAQDQRVGSDVVTGVCPSLCAAGEQRPHAAPSTRQQHSAQPDNQAEHPPSAADTLQLTAK